MDKSPSYADNLETLRQAEAWFGSRARYIHLARHPYAMIESFARLRMHKLYGHDNAEPHHCGEEVWAACNRNIRDFFAEVPASRCHTIHYEALARSPEDTARSLCAFLDIPFEPALVSPYEGERMTDGVHPTSLPLDDPNFKSHKRIEPDLADAWKRIELPIALRPETEALAAELGYSLPRSAASGPVPADMTAATERRAEAGDMATMEEHSLSVQGLRLCTCTWGTPAAEHVVLCIHGLLDHGGAWLPVAARLSRRGIMVVAPDLRGHGRSQHAPSYVWEDFLADVDATLRSLGHDRVILVGHSMGASLAAAIAAMRPERVRSLALIEPVVHDDRADRPDDVMALMRTRIDAIVAPPEQQQFPDLETAAERLRTATPSLSSGIALYLAARLTKPAGQDGALQWRWDPALTTRRIARLPMDSGTYLDMLGTLPVPSVWIRGRNSHANRESDLVRLRQALARVREIEITGGHNLHLEAPTAIADLIADFVSDQVAEHGVSGASSPSANRDIAK